MSDNEQDEQAAPKNKPATVDFVLYDELKDETGKTVSVRRHLHERSNLGLKVAGPSANGLHIENRQVQLCPKCHLLWFEELPDTYFELMKGVKG